MSQAIWQEIAEIVEGDYVSGIGKDGLLAIWLDPETKERASKARAILLATCNSWQGSNFLYSDCTITL